MDRKKRLILCLIFLLALSLLLTACGKKKAETPAEAPAEDVNTAGSEDSPEETETPEEPPADSDETDLLEDAAAFYEEMKQATEGMTNDEAVDYWLREALALVKDELPEIKQEQISDVMAELYEAGLLLEQAIYDAENWLFTYFYESGIMGGVNLKETSPVLNTAAAGARYAPTLRSVHTDANLQAVVLNGFEDIPYRTDFYSSLHSEWSELGVGVTLDSEVTVADMANLAPYDVIVFSMHGGTYLNQPILALNEIATAETDQLYYQYLAVDLSVAKVMYADGTCAYWLMPNFFSNLYGTEGLDGKIVFSESCAFYGCDCYCTEADGSMASALRNASAEAVMGYFNSVEAGYSRDVMKTTLEAMYEGQNAYEALSYAIGVHGADDDWEDPTQDKYIAYPIFMGDADTVIVAAEVPEETPDAAEEPEEEYAWVGDDDSSIGSWFVGEGEQAPDIDFGTPEMPTIDEDALQEALGYETLPDDPAIDWTDYNYASDRIYNSLMDQLIGVYAEGRHDGSFYLPYYNDTGYTFSVTIDLDYWYLGSCVSEDKGYFYTIEPGGYIEIPVNFPENCDAWNLWFTYQDIWYGDTYIG